MYRAVTWLALQQGLGPGDDESLLRIAESADICFQQSGHGAAQSVFCRGRDVTGDIRSLAVSGAVSWVSALPGVRDAMVKAQREMAAGYDVVMDGRDIGTVVLPDAECKIFMTASLEERAKRRLKEREGKIPEQVLDDIISELKSRDEEDSNRAASPLRMAEDSVLLDTTALSFQEVIDEVLTIIRASSPTGTSEESG